MEGKEVSGPSTEVTRRIFFMRVVIGTLVTISGLILAVPYLRTIIRSAPPQKLAWTPVTDVSALPLNQPVNVKFEMVSEDAYIHGNAVKSVWVIKHSAEELTVFSPICPHLGCHFNWNPQVGDFECPCHGSVFTLAGKVIGGPAPRRLDTLPHKIENGTLYVEYEVFKVGIPEKVRV
jgi:menaquinol-cytochrome c reductase iron-sulfur subunit